MSSKCNIKCEYWGADPDGSYCGAPEVMQKHIFGLSLSSPTITEFCTKPDYKLYKLTTRLDRLSIK